ncbi:T9SS type B sorting domain-containing protein [Sphingobacterium olei]|uniref:T9SS type B sorting domain-containing protein n=1 Tax=Sphingobacterium olei TaxID=2571155 RepID=A0A4V6WHP9_9SPHI|nr:gliding motility-associated C-terminal domain-containing protein [Sphingobacterium olei]TJZ54968.1 T9SS type B sorting domain-containing protein [Sphingobacterium olei]
MQGLLRHILMSFVVLLLALPRAEAQQQTLRIVSGKKVTLRADAVHALSYIWFKNGESINGFHDQRIVVTEAGVYTVIALGDGCNSDLSDPVEIIVDPLGEEITVDVEIRNLPSAKSVLVNNTMNHQLMLINHGDDAVTDLIVTFDLPREVEYVGILEGYVGTVTYDAANRQIIWKVPKMETKEALSLWVELRGAIPGTAITLATVISEHTNAELSNSESLTEVDVVYFFIPNVFTPNNDGFNDYFEIKGLESFEVKRLRVFNRHGNEVYHSQNYQNDWGGLGLKDGTYFYYLEIEDPKKGKYTTKGYVMIMRAISYRQ